MAELDIGENRLWSDEVELLQDVALVRAMGIVRSEMAKLLREGDNVNTDNAALEKAAYAKLSDQILDRLKSELKMVRVRF